MTNENEKRAHAKWDRENRGTVSANIRKEMKEDFYRVCNMNGRTPTSVLKNFINDYVVSGGRPWVVNNKSAYSCKEDSE